MKTLAETRKWYIGNRSGENKILTTTKQNDGRIDDAQKKRAPTKQHRDQYTEATGEHAVTDARYAVNQQQHYPKKRKVYTQLFCGIVTGNGPETDNRMK